MEFRFACRDDERALAALDRATWSTKNSPVELWSEEHSFFESGVPEDVIVATYANEIRGYVKLKRSVPIASNAHVLMVGGLAVSPTSQGQGIGGALLARAIDEAKLRGARRLTLHVLGSNSIAIGLYESLGLVTEGVLREEFLLDDDYVDDVVMAKDLT